MKKILVHTAIIATMGLTGCVAQRDLTEMQANVSTASEGRFGTCMASLHAGAVELEKAQPVITKGQEKGYLTDSQYDKGMRASENAVRARRQAEEACLFKVIQVEKRMEHTK